MDFQLPPPPAPRPTVSRQAIVIAILAAAGLGLFAGACFLPGRSSVSVAAPEGAPIPADLYPEERRLVEIFRAHSRSVVFIANRALVQRGPFSLSTEEVPQGSGSGFVWDKKGHIVTNFHVVRGASSLLVRLDDQSTHPASVVGVYRDKELAVLKIDVDPELLHPVEVGSSKDLVEGQTAIAIGNPFGLDHTLTVGIISSLGREIQALTGRKITDVIQTDAAINPGNSGGPLLDSHGRLIGMNTAIVSPSGASAGIGFAIPIDTIAYFANQLIENDGRIRGAGLGVSIFPDNVARRLRLDGILLQSVPPASAAGKAGLQGTTVYENGDVKLGDVILKVDGKPIRGINDLRDALETMSVGQDVEVIYEREDRERSVKVSLQAIDYE